MSCFGLYTLIIRSNKPKAKNFRRWMTHEVLPTLRKTEVYVMPGAKLRDENRRLLASARKIERAGRIFKTTLSMAKTAGFKGKSAVVRAILRDLINAEIPMNGDGTIKIGDLLNLDEIPPRKDMALKDCGLRITKDGLFIHPPTVNEHLLKGCRWLTRDMTEALCALPNVQKKIVRIHGISMRGVLIPLDMVREGGEIDET